MIRLRRLITVTAIAGSLAAGTVPAAATEAVPHHAAATVPIRTFDKKLLTLVNNKRHAKHLSAYAMSPKLWKIAHKWALHLAAQHALSHNPHLTTQIHNQCGGHPILGENVTFVSGSGATPAAILAEHLSDAPHRANIYNKSYKVVGVATIKGKYQGQSAEFNVIDFAKRC